MQTFLRMQHNSYWSYTNLLTDVAIENSCKEALESDKLPQYTLCLPQKMTTTLHLKWK